MTRRRVLLAVVGIIVAVNIISLLIVRKVEYWHVASAITVVLLIGYASQDRG
jgi:hypothetical protein